MTHPGAIKPRLPVGQGGIYMPGTARATTFLWGEREQPDHQSGTMIAADVPLRYADYIETAINMHDELVEALEELTAAIGETEAYAAARMEYALRLARAVLAKVRARGP